MKKILILSLILSTTNAFAYTSGFKPYIGINAGLNLSDYAIKINLDETYYSANINAGARIGNNFGFEFFFTHSSTNNLDFTNSFSASNHEIYYMAFGFDIYAYYNLSRNADFFTTFGVANYKMYDKYEYITATTETNTKSSDNNISTRIGIGVMYTFPGDNITGLFQYHYTPINNELVNTMSEFSVGIRYSF
mgnify:CR=1 FL=1